MAFKDNWEKTDLHFQIDAKSIENMLKQAFPNKTLLSHQVISGGCANLNIKIGLKHEPKPLILRIYLRDPDAAYREQKLGKLLADSISIPQVYFVGDSSNHRFAITEYMDGTPLRDLLLNKRLIQMSPIMEEAGLMLARIQTYRFPTSGLFDKNLHIQAHMPQEKYVEYAKTGLKHTTTLDVLGEGLVSKIDHFLDLYEPLFPDERSHNLVHADYDRQHSCFASGWRVENLCHFRLGVCFFRVHPLRCANMLRYAHMMPPEFETSFLQGLEKGGYSLPDNWRISIRLLNLLSLIDCLTRSSLDKRPNQCKDIRSLITTIVQSLESL